MKIFGMIRNYRLTGCNDHAPGWCLWPDSSMLRNNKPTFIPSESESFVLCPTMCLRIAKLGKRIAPKFASRYVDAAAAAVVIFRAQALRQLLDGETPSAESLVFDGAVMTGDFMPLSAFPDNFEMNVKYKDSSFRTLKWQSSEIVTDADLCISLISKYNTIKSGDLLLISPHPEGLPTNIDSRVTCTCPAGVLLKFNVK
ncbi:MAG: hypothetical protein NC328_05185 [Muribaculum sp.]|nr:hypothetical protein [Muribaculum sp.]